MFTCLSIQSNPKILTIPSIPYFPRKDPTDPTVLRKDINVLDEKISAALAKLPQLLDFAEREWNFRRPGFWQPGDFPRDECTRAVLALRGTVRLHASASCWLLHL